MKYKSLFTECQEIGTLVLMMVLITSLSPLLVRAEPYEDSPTHETIEPDLEWGDTYVEETDQDLREKQLKKQEQLEEGHSLAPTILFYLPNRIFDVLDIVRARVKVGPGFGAGLRFTDAGELYLGAHTSLFAGLPGPRQEPGIPIPVGIETRGGIKLSLLDGTVGMGFDPHYSSSEIGTSLHLGLVGADLMVDPVEVVDLLAGIFLLNVRDDDL